MPVSPAIADHEMPRGRLSLDSWPVIAGLLLLSVLPLLLVDLPPLVDLFGHIGRYAVQTELAERPELHPFYSYEWQLIGNLGGDILVQLFHPFFGVEGSVKLVLVANQLLAAIGILWISHQVHGRITPFAVLALPLIYGFPFTYGFLNFTLSMALALLAFAFWLRLGRLGRSYWQPGFLVPAGIAVFLCHTYGWGFLGLMCGSACLAQGLAKQERPVALAIRVVARCAPLLLPLAFILLWRSGAEGGDTGDWSASMKLVWLASILRTHWMWADVLCLIGLVCAIIVGLRARWASHDAQLGLAALCSLAAFLALPAYVFGSYYADMRLAPYALMLGLLAFRTNSRRARQILTLVAIAFLGLRSVLVSAGYWEKEREIEATLPGLAYLPKGASVATFVIEPCGLEWSPPALRHMGGIALNRRSVFANDQWAHSGVNPLRVHMDLAEGYRVDPSQIAYGDDCDQAGEKPISARLAGLPTHAFTHVWVMGEMPQSLPSFPHLRKVYADRASVVYEVAKPE